MSRYTDDEPEVAPAPTQLFDEEGPIPNFPHPTRDADGNWQTFSPEEGAARARALFRALTAISKMTDESDTPEVWEEFDRAMAENQRRKDESYGKVP